MKNFLDNYHDLTPKCLLVVCTLGDQGSVLLKKHSSNLFYRNESIIDNNNNNNHHDHDNNRPYWLEYISNLYQITHNLPFTLTYSNELGSEYQIIR